MIKNFTSLLLVAVWALAALTGTRLGALEQRLEVNESEDGSLLAVASEKVYLKRGQPLKITYQKNLQFFCGQKNAFAAIQGNEKSLTQCLESGQHLKLTAANAGKPSELEILPFVTDSNSELPWIAASFALLLAGLSWGYWQHVRYSRSRKDLGMAMQRLKLFQQRIDECIKTLTPLLDVKSQTGAATLRPSEGSREIVTLVEATEVWCRAVNETPGDVKTQLQDLRNLQSQNGPQVDGSYRKAAENLAKIVLCWTDESVDPNFQSQRIQQAVKGVVTAAGLTLLNPQAGDALDAGAHKTVGSDSAAKSSSQRRRISRVVRRGLKNAESATILKAEVKVFD